MDEPAKAAEIAGALATSTAIIRTDGQDIAELAARLDEVEERLTFAHSVWRL